MFSFKIIGISGSAELIHDYPLTCKHYNNMIPVCYAYTRIRMLNSGVPS